MADTDKAAEKKASPLRKFFWDAADRVFFIGMGVVGTVAGTYFTGLLKVNPPELVVRQSWSRVDAARPVATKVGSLTLAVVKDAARPYGVLRVEIANEGRGPAERVRFQVKLAPELAVAYEIKPDFKVYLPSAMALAGNEFYAEMATFPSRASDVLALRVLGDEKLLCSARVKFVNDAFEGEVEGLEECR